MMLLYMVTWIPSIYPLYVSIYIPAPWILWVNINEGLSEYLWIMRDFPTPRSHGHWRGAVLFLGFAQQNITNDSRMHPIFRTKMLVAYEQKSINPSISIINSHCLPMFLFSRLFGFWQFELPFSSSLHLVRIFCPPNLRVPEIFLAKLQRPQNAKTWWIDRPNAGPMVTKTFGKTASNSHSIYLGKL